MNRRKGMSLVDVLAGVVIFSIVLAAILSSLKFSSSLTARENRLALANTILSYIAEDIRTRTYSSVDGTLDSEYAPGGSRAHPDIGDLSGSSVGISVTEPNTGLKRVVISLNWTGADRPLALVIFITDAVEE